MSSTRVYRGRSPSSLSRRRPKTGCPSSAAPPAHVSRSSPPNVGQGRTVFPLRDPERDQAAADGRSEARSRPLDARRSNGGRAGTSGSSSRLLLISEQARRQEGIAPRSRSLRTSMAERKERSQRPARSNSTSSQGPTKSWPTPTPSGLGEGGSVGRSSRQSAAGAVGDESTRHLVVRSVERVRLHLVRGQAAIPYQVPDEALLGGRPQVNGDRGLDDTGRRAAQLPPQHSISRPNLNWRSVRPWTSSLPSGRIRPQSPVRQNRPFLRRVRHQRSPVRSTAPATPREKSAATAISPASPTLTLAAEPSRIRTSTPSSEAHRVVRLGEGVATS